MDCHSLREKPAMDDHQLETIRRDLGSLHDAELVSFTMDKRPAYGSTRRRHRRTASGSANRACNASSFKNFPTTLMTA
jgi:hypothetical protein